MRPPRRAVREGAKPDAGTSLDRENVITKIYNQNLKPIRGWRLSKTGPDDWTFVPPSLKHLKMQYLRKYGTAGVHYANGWKGLADMYDLYGQDYAPTLTIANGGTANNSSPTQQQATTNTRRVTISPTQQQENEEEIDDDDEETVAFDQVDNDQPGNEDQQVEVKIEHDEEENEVIVIQDEAEKESNAATVVQAQDTTTTIDKIIASIDKINQQIAWINDNPNEQSDEQAKRMKQQLVRIKERLLNQLDQLESEDQVFL